MLETIGIDTFLAVAAMLTPRELGASLGVCASWRAPLDASEHVWGLACRVAWRGKAYVPRKLRELAGGAAAVEAAAVAERDELLALRVGAIKERLRAVPRATLKECVEKRTSSTRCSRTSGGAPRRARRPTGCSRAAAARARAREPRQGGAAAVARGRARRTRITAPTSSRRTPSTCGCCAATPLAQAAAYDPWWTGKGRGEARFSTQAEGGWVRLSWPKGEDGQPMDPFVPLGMPQAPDSLEWRLEHEGAAVRLVIMGRDGPIGGRLATPRDVGLGAVLAGHRLDELDDAEPGGQRPVLAEENLADLPSDLQLAPSW